MGAVSPRLGFCVLRFNLYPTLWSLRYFSDSPLWIARLPAHLVPARYSPQMDQLTASLESKFNLTEGESDLVAADPAFAANPNAAHDLSLVGMVIIDRELSINFIRPNAMHLLHPVKGAILKSIAPNVFVIKFNHPLDQKKAMGGCPRVQDWHALILEPIDPSTKSENQELTRLPITCEPVRISRPTHREYFGDVRRDPEGGRNLLLPIFPYQDHCVH